VLALIRDMACYGGYPLKGVEYLRNFCGTYWRPAKKRCPYKGIKASGK